MTSISQKCAKVTYSESYGYGYPRTIRNSCSKNSARCLTTHLFGTPTRLLLSSATDGVSFRSLLAFDSARNPDVSPPIQPQSHPPHAFLTRYGWFAVVRMERPSSVTMR